VEYLERDPANPQNFSTTRKWFYTSIMIISVFAATFASAAYSPSTPEIITEFNTNNDWVAAGISFYVLGFALGPAIWAPLSELYGRRPVFNISLCATTACIGAGAGCKNMASLLVFRFLAGTFGASPLVNSGGVISDLWPQSRIGIAMSVFSASPMLGPILGPVIGGFVTMMVGWRWVQGICCIFVGLVWIGGASMLPETYGPVILRKMADQLSKTTGKRYSSLIDKETRGVHASQAFNKVLTRPWVLLIWEPIVLIAAVYVSSHDSFAWTGSTAPALG
jgi:MFS family permease